jgi:phosphoribosyl 1,2-cyclic phosphodiesterase
MIRFVSLGSGSKGNALLVHAGTTRILIDCGLGIRALTERLGRAGVIPEQLDAVLVTHEHSDHCAGLRALQRRTGCPVFATAGTLRAMDARAALNGPRFAIVAGTPIEIDDLRVEIYTVPHDASEPVQFVLGDGERRLGILTDAGHVTEAMVGTLSRCDGLVLEFNHDRQMLANGPYPAFLKQRIAGERGHLANDTSAALLRRLAHDGLQHVLGAHLSEQNNQPALVRAAMAGALGVEPAEVCLASQYVGSGWLELRGQR